MKWIFTTILVLFCFTNVHAQKSYETGKTKNSILLISKELGVINVDSALFKKYPIETIVEAWKHPIEISKQISWNYNTWGTKRQKITESLMLLKKKYKEGDQIEEEIRIAMEYPMEQTSLFMTLLLCGLCFIGYRGRRKTLKSIVLTISFMLLFLTPIIATKRIFPILLGIACIAIGFLGSYIKRTYFIKTELG